MSYDLTAINRAVQRFPIEDYLKSHGARRLKGKPEWELPCPGCGKDKMFVNANKRAWHCWVCQREKRVGRGGLLDLLQLLDHITKEQAVERVLHSFHDAIAISGITLDLVYGAWDEAERPTVPIPLPPYWRQGSVDYATILPYCRRRGITHADVHAFSIGWCSDGRYGGRLVFPVFEGGDLVYWQARAMWEKHEHSGQGKYVKSLNPPKIDEYAAGSESVLFNLDRAAQYPRVCITEGPIDAIHVGSDAVATFGKKLYPVQLGKLLRAGVTAIDIMWDGPSTTEPQGAWCEMWDAAFQLDGIFDVRLVFLPGGDPGDYPQEHLHWFREVHSRQLRDSKPRLAEV